VDNDSRNTVGWQSRSGISRRDALVTAGKVGITGAAVAAGLQSLGMSPAMAERAAAGGLPKKSYKFVFVNHVTTNPFFTPTQYGIQDACAALGCSY